jgi:protein-tyrosine-phosphatase/DNA-binding transcriptional ArsR family regulator
VPPAEVSPPFLGLLGHPVRWRLVRELSRSDRRVRELVGLVGEPQNLLSYHLGKLRAARIVAARRSSFDGRDTYYHLDLRRCAESLTGTGTALHPGLRLDLVTAAPPSGVRRRVLFLCTGNSARSPMAAALLRHRGGPAVDAVSAGSRPKPLHPNAVRVLRGYGIDLVHRPTRLDAVREQHFDAVISLCDRVREVCPEFPGGPEVIHWSVPDPALEGDTDAETFPAFERTAAALDERVRFFLHRLAELPAPERKR